MILIKTKRSRHERKKPSQDENMAEVICIKTKGYGCGIIKIASGDCYCHSYYKNEVEDIDFVEIKELSE